MLVLRHQPGPDLDLVPEFQHPRQDTPARDAALQVIDLRARFVDVEGTDDDHVRRGAEVADGDGDLVDDALVDGVDIVLELSGDGDDGRFVGDGAPDEVFDRLIVLLRALGAHQVDLVLKDDDVVEFHDLDGGQVFGRLRLRAGFVPCDEEECGVHDRCAGQHGAHEDIVAGAVDESGERRSEDPVR